MQMQQAMLRKDPCRYCGMTNPDHPTSECPVFLEAERVKREQEFQDLLEKETLKKEREDAAAARHAARHGAADRGAGVGSIMPPSTPLTPSAPVSEYGASGIIPGFGHWGNPTPEEMMQHERLLKAEQDNKQQQQQQQQRKGATKGSSSGGSSGSSRKR